MIWTAFIYVARGKTLMRDVGDFVFDALNQGLLMPIESEETPSAVLMLENQSATPLAFKPNEVSVMSLEGINEEQFNQEMFDDVELDIVFTDDVLIEGLNSNLQNALELE